MPLASKFPDHNCKSCGVLIKKGDPVNKQSNGKWCSNANCPNPPGNAAPQKPATEPKKEIIPGSVKVSGPFDEAELITRWAREKAYKMTMSEVIDINKLTPQEKSGLGQAQGMLTRCLVDTTIELMKIHGIKTNYGADAFE